MDQLIDLHEIDTRIRIIKEAAEELNRMGGGFPALARNTSRLLASLKMLEINVSDVADLEIVEST